MTPLWFESSQGGLRLRLNPPYSPDRRQRVRRSNEGSMLTRGLLTALMIASVGFDVRAETAGGPAPEFAVGQEWSIKSASPTTAKAVIDRLEPWHEKVVAHVSIVDLPIPQGLPGAGGTTVIGHMPFERSAFAASVDRLLAINV